MTSRAPRPPRIARWCVTILLSGERRDLVVGDLDEDFAERLAAGEPRRSARRRYWRLAVASIAASAFPPRLDPADRAASAWTGLAADLRHVLRRLGASPGYCAIAVLSLAVGIGANTAIASVARNALVDRLPVERPDELRALCWSYAAKSTRTPDPRLSGINTGTCAGATESGASTNVTYPLFRALTDAAPRGAAVAALTFIRKVNVLAGNRAATVAGGMLVSGQFFDVVRPVVQAGRGIGPADDRRDAETVAVISDAFWSRAFDRSPEVFQERFVVNGAPVRIIGITGPGFRGLSRGGFFPAADVMLPLSAQPLIQPRFAPPTVSLFASDAYLWLRVLVRAPGISDARLIAALEPTLRGYADGRLVAPDKTPTVRLRPVSAARGLESSNDAGVVIGLLGLVVAAVLLIACVNLATLMLARGMARQGEMAVRRALGASRWRLARLVLVESLVPSLAGAAAGVLLAVWSQRAVSSTLAIGWFGVDTDMPLDWRLLATSTAVAIVAAIVCGLVPALRLTGRRATAGLAVQPRAGTAPRTRIARALLAAQIAASLPLVVGAGLLVRTVGNLYRIDPGFSTRSLVVFAVDPSVGRPDPRRTNEALTRIVDRLPRVPGLVSAAVVENVLLSGWTSNFTVRVGGQDRRPQMNAIGAHFFETMGIPIVAGRGLRESDTADTPGVIVVNETAARQYFGGFAIGQRAVINGFDFVAGVRAERDVEVVGVAKDTLYGSLRGQVQPTIYDAFSQRPGGLTTPHVVVRASGPASALEQPIRRAVAEVDPLFAVADYRSQAAQVDETIARERLFAKMLALFGVFALVLASVGLHGVTSYSVAGRTTEIGVRMALGAGRSQVVWLLLKQVVGLAAAGLLLGVPASMAAAPALRSLLFGLGPADPATIAGAAALMLAVTVAAGWRPARRAASLDPLRAMRHD